MRLVYLGTPAAAVPPLVALVEAGHEVSLVVSRADKRRSRRGAPEPSPVKAAALELGLPVTSTVDDALEADAELGVVVAFGRLIRPQVLAELPMVNVHFSLLPRWRGAAPVERALLAGDAVTGACIMALDEGLDTGPVYGCSEVPIRPDDTAGTLRDRLVAVGTTLLVELLDEPLPQPVPQSGEPTYAEKIEVEELRIDWHRTAGEIDRLVRVGGAWTTIEGQRLKVWAATATDEDGEPGRLTGTTVGAGEGSLRLVQVQPAGKPRRDAVEWSRGVRSQPATLGS